MKMSPSIVALEKFVWKGSHKLKNAFFGTYTII